MKSAELKKKINEEGWLHIRMIQELAGLPKEYVERTMDVFNGRLEGIAGVKVLEREAHPAKKVEGGIWSMFSELEILVKNLSTLILIIYEFTPSSVEIIDSAEPIQESRIAITGILNDLIAKIQSMDKVIKRLHIANKHLQEKLKVHAGNAADENKKSADN